MKLTKKGHVFLCILAAFAMMAFISCDSDATNPNLTLQNQGTVLTVSDPPSYGESSLPQLTKTAPFAGQSYIDKTGWTGFFFNNDGTVTSKTTVGITNGSNSLRQWKKNTLASYTYDPATRVLTVKPIGLFFGDRLITTAADAVTWKVNMTKLQAAYQGISSVIIPNDWMYANLKQYEHAFANAIITYSCTIQNDCLLLEDSKANEGKYKYEKDNVKIKFNSGVNEAYSISIKNNDDELNSPVITSIGNGVFTGSDYKWSYSGTVAALVKQGDFAGTYEFKSGNCYLTLTSVTGNINSNIQNMVGKEYVLSPRDDNDTTTVCRPIRKTINYTVIGSDGQAATNNAQAYLDDSSSSSWTKDTLKVLTSRVISDIYSDAECTQSVIGKEILDGVHVYVKLSSDLTAINYNLTVQNY